MKSYTLNKLPLSSCRIVYGASPIKGSVGSLTGNTVEQDIGRFMQGENRACEFDKQCAEELGRNVAEFFGVSLETVCVDDTDLRDGDILVGKVGAVAAPTDERAYVCDTVQVEAGSCFSIVGGSYGATWHAIAALCEYWKAGEVTDLAHGMPKTGLAPLKTVACLGDSITRGSQALPDANGFGTPDGLAASFGGAATSIYFEQFLSYPANLQRSLWKDYLIFNFGRGFSSMRKLCVDASGGPVYYRETAAYERCRSYSKREDFCFDAVLIMLGTNDSGRDGGAKTWGAEQREDYFKEAKLLVDEMVQDSPCAKIVLMTVPHSCDCHSPSQNNAAVRQMQRDAVARMRQDGYDISCFDMGAYTAEHMGTGHGATKEEEIEIHADYYNIRTETGKPDTTHPNYRGYASIACGVEGLVLYLLADGDTPEYLVDVARS